VLALATLGGTKQIDIGLFTSAANFALVHFQNITVIIVCKWHKLNAKLAYEIGHVNAPSDPILLYHQGCQGK
jgi:hypothetical protein